MTPDQLHDEANIIYKFATRERKWRERVFRDDPAKMARKVAECDAVIDALRNIKLFANLHTEQPPEQVELFDDLPAHSTGIARGY